uniref:Tubulin glycylase 3A-like n=1 Tax=Bombyx mori TaxID=7091 RepID=A0A8R2DLL2_BOMMO|nr:tubulin glycylase 3A [Bombyx mori]XP_021205580.2 tubulin glycylase 3A [Bombyx mori]XP_021205581.2 tubulin glycylase 3A [Bombyx mori]
MPSKKKKLSKRKVKVKSDLLSKGKLKCCHNETKCTTSNNFEKTTPTSTGIKSSLDEGGLKRILSPFNKFANTSSNPRKNTVINSPYRCIGLSSKEKSYIISNCQARSTRYSKLKNIALNAIQNRKIFSIYGPCNTIRKLLLQRGWVEKINPDHMNLLKLRNGNVSNKTEIHGELERLLLSNLVESYIPNFVWYNKENVQNSNINVKNENTTVCNKLKIDTAWTTKQGLCSLIKQKDWFYIENTADVIVPRTYNSYEGGETEAFVNDYKVTACTGLLKWILSMVANEKAVFCETGKISLNVMVFALNRCKEYLFQKQHLDIDRSLTSVNSNQWNNFLKKYYRIVSRNELFHLTKEEKIPIYLSYAQFLLKEIQKYRPQIICEGYNNVWILKPAHCSRGRGIRIASKLGVINDLIAKANSKYVIQKYIEEPMLIHETKFDIRQYYLITSTYPLIIWIYKDCYLKFSSQKYNLGNYHESIHLTNNAVQRRYMNCEERHPDLPNNNMWDLDTYKDYLKAIGKPSVWDDLIYPGMKKTITGVMLSSQETMPACKNRFELYGCDFLLDKDYKPWLIEINACPDLNSTTRVTAKICPAVLADVIKVVIDYAADKNASTGNFECAYRQTITTPNYGGAADFIVKGFPVPHDYFYKGNIKLEESFEDIDMDKPRDVQAVLKKLKRFYNSSNCTDRMLPLENNELYCDKDDINRKSSHKTVRSFLDDDAENLFINDERKEMETSLENFPNFKSHLFDNYKLCSETSLTRLKSTKSLTNIKTLMKESNETFFGSAHFESDRLFSFTKLDEVCSLSPSLMDY